MSGSAYDLARLAGRRCSTLLAAILILSVATTARGDEAGELGLRVPPGFEVSLYADDTLAHDIYSMTLDEQGRVVVSGRGYVKTLHDDDGDGRAERATLYSSVPASGAQGMLFDGGDLICTGDHALMRLRDADRDGTADGPPEVWAKLNYSEHGAHAIVRGPEGDYYVACGNNAGDSRKLIAQGHSPVEHPRSGAIARFSPDGRPRDVFAHGFRNAYDIGFNSAGHLFTVDSDGERDQHIPWYAPSRMFDVGQGLEHGWLPMDRTNGWNRPPSMFDSVQRLVEFGRGSPTGLVVYRHRAFPERYRGGVFTACWSLGRVYFCPLETSGASYRSQAETFLQTTGDIGFAPCDLAVGPEGDLFVAIGGRRTRGSVFRVHATGPIDGSGKPAAAARSAASSDLDVVLAAAQPGASWSRAHWLPVATKLGRASFEQAALDGSRPPEQRVRAIEVAVELDGAISFDVARRLAADASAPVRARTAWSLSRMPSEADWLAILAQLTGDDDHRVQRAAWEALALAEPFAAEQSPAPDWSRGTSSTERRVRMAAILTARRAGRASYQQSGLAVQPASSEMTAAAARRALADLWVRKPDDDADPHAAFSADDVQTCVDCFRTAGDDTRLALEAVRLLQIALGDFRTSPKLPEVYIGYAGRADDVGDSETRATLVTRLAGAFPTGDAELDRELARLLAMLSAQDTALLSAVAAKWTDDTSVEEDIHYLIVASRLPGERSADVSAATASALLGLHHKLDALEQFASRNWPFRVAETFQQLCRHGRDLADALVDHPQFGHPHHALFVDELSSVQRRAAIARLWSRVDQSQAKPTSEMVALAGALPPEQARATIVSRWDDDPGLRDAIVLVLADHPQAEDREKFVAALASAQPDVVRRAADALIALGINCRSSEMAAALRALKQACATAKPVEPRHTLVRLLNFWTEENSGVESPTDPTQTWVDWYQLFEDYYPAFAAQLRRSSGTDAAGWKKRLAGVDWHAGDAERGRAVFQERSCHRCHEQSGHLGPALNGVSVRFSRDDLFAAIVDPNLEVAPPHQTTTIITRSGQVHHGLIVYESPEITLLQTGPDTTVRITNTDRSAVRRGTQSIMPTGLLDPLSDQELSDLYAYLKTLQAH